MKNPEKPELDWHQMIHVVYTRLIDRDKLSGLIKDGSMIPVSLGDNYNLYFGGQFHNDMVREDDVLFEAYAKLVDGKVNIVKGVHHKQEIDPKIIEAMADLLTEEFEKYLK